MAEQLPPDADQRRRITDELDATLFVEAGAGSGKTQSLVDRIVALVTVAAVPMREIAAITFTDKAAAELRDRVRRELEQVARGSDATAVERAGAALDELDGAAVSTLHAFAQRLLTEHPLAAGLPPRVEIADELSSQLEFEQRWSAFLDELLDESQLKARPDDELAVVLLLEARRPIEALRDVAVEFERNWDLVADHVIGRPVPPLAPLDVHVLVERLRLAAAERFSGDDDDKLVLLLTKVDEATEQLEQAASLRDQLRALTRLADLDASRTGNKQKWRGSPWHLDLQPLRDLTNAALAPCRLLVREIAESCLRRLAAHIADFTIAAAEARRRDGRLAFHDLLVLARQMLNDTATGPATRTVLRQHYTRLLLDEFQDTDPIQVEIASLLATDPDRPHPARLDDGRLFFVGDPKQSIYRFRRADIATFLDTRARVTDEPVRLTANFRTTAPVVAWVNAVFEHLITEVPRAQPAYQALQAQRHITLAGPPVLVFDAEHEDKPNAAELRAREVRDVVATVQAALDRWEVDDDGVRAARFGDIAILIPTRTVLSALEDALDGAGLPYRTESSSLVYASREARDLLLALRAIDDASDELALVSSLRSPLFGCSDVDLHRWRSERGGRWDVLATTLPPRLGGPDPVHDALTWLGALAAERHWRSPAELLDQLVRERRVLELAGTGPRARDVWRRTRYLIDQARAWREAGGGSLRGYVAWAHQQASDAIRVTEAVLPETDHDAVRIMTIHAAKGLEFPIVILAGLTTRPRRGRGGVDVLWTPSGPQLRLDDTFVTREYEATRALDEQLDEHERRRLLYVACTRARDHLAVSLHRPTRTNDSASRSLAELVAEHSLGLGLHVALSAMDLPPSAPRAAAAVASAPDLDRWRAEQAELLTRAGRPRTIAATSLTPHDSDEPQATEDPGLGKGGVDLDLPPWRKGRYGTAIGRAVHAVLQTVDLATGEGVEAAAAAQAASEGVLGRERTIAALARSALRSSAVHAAVASDAHWREVLVAAPVGDQLLEGYIDLLYRADDGLVVVDYKTDQPRDETDLDERVQRYRLQLAAYALAVERVTGERVRQAVLVFCSAAGEATERATPDLAEAMEDVAARLAATTAETPPTLPV